MPVSSLRAKSHLADSRQCPRAQHELVCRRCGELAAAIVIFRRWGHEWMRFGVEYNLTKHELLRSVCQCRTSESMRLTVIEAYLIWVVQSEISTSVRVT
jgi:hypothetical protein